MNGKILLEYIRDSAGNEEWLHELEARLPLHQFETVHRNQDESIRDSFSRTSWQEEIEYVISWTLRGDELAMLPHLRAVLLLGAGADQMMPLDALPSHIPIVRLVDPEVAQDMSAYALHWVLHLHFGFNKYMSNQYEKVWRPLRYTRRKDFVVGVLGLGNVGSTVCNTLLAMGYRVRGWSRSKKDINGVDTFVEPELDDFLSEVYALINVLPLTVQTENLLNASRFRKLPRGAILINMGRGRTVNDPALIDALNSGHLRAAVLDTFAQEPLPPDSPLWSHKKVIVTPHVSGCTNAETSARYIADNIKRIEAGEDPFPVIDRALTY